MENGPAFEPPAYLSPLSRIIWAETVQALQEQASLGLSPTLDRHIMECYVNAMCRLRKAYAELEQSGHVLANSRGNLYRNPYSTIAKETEQTVLQLGTRLGLNPRARQILGAKLTGDDAEFDED